MLHKPALHNPANATNQTQMNQNANEPNEINTEWKNSKKKLPSSPSGTNLKTCNLKNENAEFDDNGGWINQHL